MDVLQLAVPGRGRGGKAQVIILHLCHKDMKPPNGERYDGGSVVHGHMKGATVGAVGHMEGRDRGTVGVH